MLAMSSVGWFGLGLVGFILLVALAFWPARVARRKGHSWLLFFIFSLFFFPAAVILAYVVRDRRREVVVYAR
jgi:ABC-type Mn2+/Zn2+ transport system permease subunit